METGTLFDMQVLAMQLRTLRLLFEGLDEQMVALAQAGYVMTSEQEEMVLTRVLTHTEFASHVSTAVAASLSGILRDALLPGGDG